MKLEKNEGDFRGICHRLWALLIIVGIIVLLCYFIACIFLHCFWLNNLVI